jgi:hypothetical protein
VLWLEQGGGVARAGWCCGSSRVVLWIEKGGDVDREGWCCGS